MGQEQLNEISTILDMVQGGVNEIINDNVADILLNIKDPNTDNKARELIVKVKMKPLDDSRKTINVEFNTSKKIRPIKSLATTIAVGVDDNGQMQAVELQTNLAGQMMLNNGEVPKPKVLNFRKKA